MLNLHIVTPAKNVLSTNCDDVVLPGFDGEMGILSEHAHLINKLGAGILKIHSSNQTQTLAISGGVVEIGENQITVLADEAVFAKDINASMLSSRQKKLTEEFNSLSDSVEARDKWLRDQKWLDAQTKLLQDNV